MQGQPNIKVYGTVLSVGKKYYHSLAISMYGVHSDVPVLESISGRLSCLTFYQFVCVLAIK